MRGQGDGRVAISRKHETANCITDLSEPKNSSMPTLPHVIRSYMKSRVVSILPLSRVPKSTSRSVLVLDRVQQTQRSLRVPAPRSQVAYLQTIATSRFSTMASATSFYDLKPLDSMHKPHASPFPTPPSSMHLDKTSRRR